MTYKKKLIEVAIPLEAINAASAREKSIRHGHPSTLHLWWARRPLAACRAVLFAQLVDDPSSHPDKFPTEEAVEAERKRLFVIIEDLVKWENSTNEEVLTRARNEIMRSCDGKLPPVYDPFSGGGSIPLEAQRLGLPAYGSDLNPVAVMIGRAMIEIPPKFKDMQPIHPGDKDAGHGGYKNAQGLAEDVKYYGEWMRKKAFERIGHLYPEVTLSGKDVSRKTKAVAWIWARGVPSPNPAFNGAITPLVNSYAVSTKASDRVIIEPLIDRETKTITFEVVSGDISDEQLSISKKGTKAGKAEHFLCAYSNEPITREYIRGCAKSGKMTSVLLVGVVLNGTKKEFVPAESTALAPSLSVKDLARVRNIKDVHLSGKTPVRAMVTGGVCSAYGMETWGDLFTDRQVLALDAFSTLIDELHVEVQNDFLQRNPDRSDAGKDYADAMATLMTCAIGRAADFWSSNATWESSGGFISHVFTRQGLPMVWDFAESNPFSEGTGSWSGTCVEWVKRVIDALCPNASGKIEYGDAASLEYSKKYVFSTDPPYFDNISYAVLSDYFYIWHKKSLGRLFPDIYSFIATPKNDELIAMPYRTGGDKTAAEEYFLNGMQSVMAKIAQASFDQSVVTIYYAFKQSEVKKEGTSSTGWATFLQAVLNAGLSVVGTWPIRTERSASLVAAGTNALANSVVLVCRKKEATAETITRAEFLRTLKRELPPAISELQAANVSPADMPQSAIGPGMGVFSRYAAVLEADDTPMSVKTALQLINAQLDEFLNNLHGDLDPDTRFAATWFEQHGLGKGEYGAADNLARARGISVESVKHAGIIESSAGKVSILKRDELDPDWDPETDDHLTVWEACQYLIRALESDGEYAAAELLKKLGGDKAEMVKDLAYYLYDVCANKRQEAKEATAYNGLIAVWPELTRQAATITLTDKNRQARMDL